MKSKLDKLLEKIINNSSNNKVNLWNNQIVDQEIEVIADALEKITL